jgi:hypothetical protein
VADHFVMTVADIRPGDTVEIDGMKRAVRAIAGPMATLGDGDDELVTRLDAFDAVFIGRTETGQLAWSLAEKAGEV